MRSLIFFLVFSISCYAYSQQYYDESPNKYRFKYGSKIFKGSKLQITTQLRTIKNSPKFSGIPEEIQIELNKLFKDTKSQVFPRIYRKKAIAFLDALYRYEKFVIMYNGALNDVVEKLKRDIRSIDYKLEKQFIKAQTSLNRVKKEDPTNQKEITHLTEELKKSRIRLLSHRWMKKKFETYKGVNMVENPDELITEFKKKESAYIFSVYEIKSVEEIKRYLENEIIDFYYKKAIIEIDLDKLELLYTKKYNVNN